MSVAQHSNEQRKIRAVFSFDLLSLVLFINSRTTTATLCMCHTLRVCC